MEHFQGYVERTIHRGDEFAIVAFRSVPTKGEPSQTFTAVGPIPADTSKSRIELHGEWVTHPKFGNQLKVKSAFLSVPSTSRGVAQFIEHNVKGIGPAKAKAIADKFGSNLAKVIEESPNTLLTVPGVKEKHVASIIEAWKEHTFTRNLSLFLGSNDINLGWSERIYNTLGPQALEVIQKNPYRLVDIKGIGFAKADEIAMKMGWKTDSEERTQAVLKFLLEKASDEGNVYLPREVMLQEACKECGVPESLAGKLLDGLIHSGTVIQESTEVLPGVDVHLVYLPWLHKSECGIAEHAKRLNHSFSLNIVQPVFLEKVLGAYEKKYNLELTDKQKQAVCFALQHPLSILTGGPGTGKTAVVKAIVEIAATLAWDIALASPTGRAAKHMENVSGLEAQTVHRLLGYKQVDGKWKYTKNRHDPIKANLLVVDECSMLDTDMTYRVFDAVPNGCHTVLIGDDNQLPSVGPGKVLADLIKSGRIPTSTLDKIHRQAEKSLIIKNAHLILHGDRPMFPPRLKGEWHYDSYFFEAPMDGKSEDVEWVKKSLTTLCSKVIPNDLKLDPIKDVQVLAPMKDGAAGVNMFNTVLQNALNPDGKVLKLGFKEFRVGDRVMVTKNNYDLDVFNGHVGIIKAHDRDNQLMHIEFADKEILYPFKDAKDDLQLAYCQTVHKVQGGEFPVVVVILLKRHFVMLQRNLLYTAITRAKDKVIFIGSRQALEMSVKNNKIKDRNSFLAHRIREKETKTSCPVI